MSDALLLLSAPIAHPLFYWLSSGLIAVFAYALGELIGEARGRGEAAALADDC